MAKARKRTAGEQNTFLRLLKYPGHAKGGSISQMSVNQRRDESTIFSTSSRTSTLSTTPGGSDMFRVPPGAGISINAKNKTHKPISSITTQATQVYEELNCLKLSSLALYGREHELKTLMTFVEELETKDSGLNLMLVTGSSGTGKTALVKEFTSQLARDKSIIVAAGKFDQHCSVPCWAFVAAFTQLCQNIPSHPLYQSMIRPAILDAVGNDYKLLLDLIPNLRDLILDGDNSSSSCIEDSGPHEFNMVKSKEKFKFLLQRFLHAVCQPSHKVALVLDDIQWMDSASAKLWETILSDSVLAESMWVVGVTCDKINDLRVVSKTLDSVQKRRGKVPSILTLKGFSFETTMGYIAELLNVDNVESLASIAYQRVQGNIYCLIQFLTLIRDKGFLHYDISSMKWVWAEEDIRRSTVVSNNVLIVLMEKVDRLPSDAKQLLQVMTCLGGTFSEDLITLVHANLNILDESSSNKRGPKVMVDLLLTEGLLEEVNLAGIVSSKCYCFSHSQIGIVAMEMTKDFTKLQFHVGRILWENQHDIDYQGMLFTIVDLLNGGKEHMHGSKQIRMLINLNYQAGKKALESSAFGAAMEYLHDAINLIPMATRWGKDYDLTLQIYNCLIKAEYSHGTWDLLRMHTEEVIAQKDRPIVDKIIAYTASISVLSIQEHNHVVAIELAIHVLELLGTTFWLKGGKLSVVGGLLKTKKLLSKIPLERLLIKNEMTDNNKLVALEIIAHVNSSMYACNPDLLMCSVLKTLRWSLKYGLARDTAKCVSFFGLVEMALGNVAYGREACNLAIKLAEKQHLMNTEYAPIGACYGFVLPWTTPMHTCSSKLLLGYNLGLESGDLHYGFLNITLYCYFLYCCGKPFEGLESDMRQYARQMREYKQLLQLQFLRLTWQAILNLMGRCDRNPAVLSGEVMKYHQVLRVADADKNPPLRAQVQCHRLELAVYYQDFNLAAKLIGPASAVALVNPGNPIIWRNALFEGIAAFELCRRGEKKWKSIALKALSKTQKWVDGGNVNCVHILYLLQAEKAAMEKNMDAARQLFDKAIVTAARNGFRNDRALATERCAAMHESAKDEIWFEDYFVKAIEAYQEIGAVGKVDHMTKKRDECHGKSIEGSSYATGSEGFSLPVQKRDVDVNRTISDLTGINFPI